MKLAVTLPLLLLLGPADSAAQSAPGKWISFETIDQSALPIVRVKLNGGGGHRLVIDPSFNDFVLDPLLVEGSGLELASAGEALVDYYGKKEKMPVAILDELRVGDLSFTMVRTVLVAGEDGTGMGGLRSYGRIGRDLLEPLRLTVHYPRRLLYFENAPPEVPAGGVAYEPSGRFLTLPVTLEREGGSEDARLVIDAGTSGTLLDRKWAVEHGFASKGAYSAQIATFRIADLALEKFRVSLGDMKELPYAANAVGVIGADLLLRCSVTYDFSRDRIWLVQVKEEVS
jgi:hypothetical protein